MSEDSPRIPEEPRHLKRLLAGEELGPEELEELNTEAANIWSREVLVRCQHCGR